MIESALYEGVVTHRRIRPKAHILRYRVFWLLLDLEKLNALDRRLRCFSVGRFNLFSFYEGDHGTVGTGSLAARVRHTLQNAGVDIDGGSIRLFCMPRVLGYAFNPLSIYFCSDAAERLVAILYEVNNTFGQRHGYLIPVAASDAWVIEQSCAKELYVSPFIPMAMTYDFRVVPPADAVSVTVHVNDAKGLLLAAALSGRRRELSDAGLVRLFFVVPFLTFKVIAGIHWEALKLWAKRFRLIPRSDPPTHEVTRVPVDNVEFHRAR